MPELIIDEGIKLVVEDYDYPVQQKTLTLFIDEVFSILPADISLEKAQEIADFFYKNLGVIACTISK